MKLGYYILSAKLTSKCQMTLSSGDNIFLMSVKKTYESTDPSCDHYEITYIANHKFYSASCAKFWFYNFKFINKTENKLLRLLA